MDGKDFTIEAKHPPLGQNSILEWRGDKERLAIRVSFLAGILGKLERFGGSSVLYQKVAMLPVKGFQFGRGTNVPYSVRILWLPELRGHIESFGLGPVDAEILRAEIPDKLKGADRDDILNATGLGDYSSLKTGIPVRLVEINCVHVTGRVEPVILVDSFLKNDSFGSKLPHFGLKAKSYHKIFLLFMFEILYAQGWKTITSLPF